MSDCEECRWVRVEGSTSTAGGNEAQGFDQTGCDLPILVEAYVEGEATAILLEGLMITQAESEQGCPWRNQPITGDLLVAEVPVSGEKPGVVLDWERFTLPVFDSGGNLG